MKHNIILIGFMGSGKTCVGDYLAKQLGFRFQDTDHLIEKKTKESISHIFSDHGEEYFRDLETSLLLEMVPALENTVLSTGGGLPIREENSVILKELGFVVYLKASKETTISRLRGDSSRPLLQGDEMEAKVERMLALRTPIYEKTAHDIVITDDKTVEEISCIILKAYEEFKVS